MDEICITQCLCAQVHCHFKQFLNVDLSPWTQVEDVQLLENVRSLIIYPIIYSLLNELVHEIEFKYFNEN
jgi:hypothetical protein